MHGIVAQDHQTLASVAEWIAARLSPDSEVFTQGTFVPPEELPALSLHGIGTAAAWETVRDSILPTAFPTDHPRYLAFVGGAPTPASVFGDAALSAAGIYGGSELEAGRVVTAERAALRWLSDALGYPAEAHGAFVSGGSTANLSALVAARHGRVAAHGRAPSIIVVGGSGHSSLRSAAGIMGCDVVVAGSPDRALTAADLEIALAPLDLSDVVAVVASAGATNTGTIDELDLIADLCDNRRLWLHVDAAYGGAAILSATARSLFIGIERADSVTIDPHKWLFTPYDCAAVIYREPARARAAHRQAAHYLDAVNEDDSDNPADYAIHLSRRARGLPLWMSLLAYGTAAYSEAVEQCLFTAQRAARAIEARTELTLVTDPHLSVVLFQRQGWTPDDYAEWSVKAQAQGIGLVTPTKFAGETVLRFCFVNPTTSDKDVAMVLDNLEGDLR